MSDLIQTLESIETFVKQLEVMPGRKDKEQAFSLAVRKIPEFRQYVLYTYNPFKSYHVRKLPQPDGSVRLETFSQLLEYLDSLDMKGSASLNDAVVLSNSVVDSPTALSALQRLLNRSLGCGIGEKTIFKYAKELGLEIRIPAVMLCQSEPSRLFGRPVLIQPKLDGIRCLAYIENGKVRACFSRSFKPLYGALEFLKTESFGSLHDVWLDGELYGTNFQELVKTARIGDGSTISVFQVFDFLSSRGSKLHQLLQLRYEQLSSWDEEIFGPKVRLLKGFAVKSLDEVEVTERLSEAVDAGFEGLVIKDLESPYQPGKRSHLWQKVKMFHSIEAEVIGFELGTGKFEGVVGALKCKAVINGNTVFFKVGSGMTDSEREEFLTKLPRIIEVRFQELTRDGVPRFPVFSRVREFSYAEKSGS